MSSYRIRTQPGESKNIIIELKQDFDFLQILSLKFSQSEVYTRMCSDYGVVCGRVSSNHGFGIPNVKVSIFIPLDVMDEDDPIISTLYPYKSVSDKNEDGYRYNLLPYKKSHSGHSPTGTFPSKEDVLHSDTVLELYEKYYKYTTKTNQAGDYLIWGVPLGTQTLHAEVDMSDMGCFSARPYDLMQQGVASLGKFKNAYEYKSSVDIDSLPQIIKFDKTIDVVPFWGNEDMCQIGISRCDCDFSELGISLQPTSLFIGSVVTDSGTLAVKKNGKPKRHQGYKCKLDTYAGEIEAIRFTGRKYKDKDGNYYPELERVPVETIDEEGTWMCSLPMNMDYIVTNEFGDEEFSNDPNKGVATSGIYRFRVNTNYEHRKMEVGSYLIPNIREFTNRSAGELDENNYDTKLSYTFSTDFDDYFRYKIDGVVKHENKQIRDLILGKNNEGIPEDYFYKFTYNKVYSAASFHGSHFEGNFRDAFIGIKEIVPNEDHDCNGRANKLPVNFGFRNRVNFQLILAQVLLFFKFVAKAIHIRVVEIVGGLLLKVGKALEVWPIRKPAQKLQHTAYKWQESSQVALPLSIYPICEECGQETVENDESVSVDELNECVVASGSTTMVIYKDNSSYHQLTFTFNGFNAIQPGIECSNATALSFNSLGTLQNQLTMTTPDEGTRSRFALVIFSLSGSTEQVAVTPISSGGYYFQYDSSSGTYFIEFTDVTEMLEFMSEADPTIVAGQIPENPKNYFFKIYDLDGTTNQTNPIVEYEVETGCDKYDKFYNEKLLHPNKFIWAVSDNDYGSSEISIETQNQFVVTSGATYGGGIFPAEVLRYYSYDSTQRNLYITGLDSLATYDIEIVGSRRQPTTVSGETTNYTIGSTTQTLATNNNLTNSVIFNNVAPIFDKVTISIDNGTNMIHNYINGLKITNNTTSQEFFINVFGGYDPYASAQWNNFSVGLGNQSNVSFYNLIDTVGNISQVNIELTNSLGVLSNDIVSLYQKIYFKPILSSGDASSPYSINDYSIIASVAAATSSWQLPTEINFSRIGRQTYSRKTKTGFTEIRNGLIMIVPVIRGKSVNLSVLKEWYNRNKVNTSFCGGVVNHAFIDNWLTGILYAFKFQFRKGSKTFVGRILNGREFKYPRELVYFDTDAALFYYRSTPYDVKRNKFIGQSATYANNRKFKEILRPTTITDLGPRDEFMSEICVNKKVDPNCSVIRDISTTSYQNIEEILEYSINYRLDVTKSKIKLKDFFSRNLGRIQLFDGDIVQLESINCEVGIEEFDLDNPKYFMYNGELLDPEDPRFFSYFNDLTTQPIKYGPTPIDFKLDDEGRQVRLCLNHPDYLGETSQIVPFYLWDKKGQGFGTSKNQDAQEFKKDFIVAQKLQRIISYDIPYDDVVSGVTALSQYTPSYGKKYLVLSGGTMNSPTSGTIYTANGVSWTATTGYTKVSNYIYNNGTEEYILYPMTKEHNILDVSINGPDSFERFDYVSKTGTDKLNYMDSPEGTIFLEVVTGTVDNPFEGFFYVMKNRKWDGPHSYVRNADDTFISPTANNYNGNLQVLSTPYLYYFGLKPGKTSFDRFITHFGPKDAFK